VLRFFRGDGLATLKPGNLQSAAAADLRKIFVPKNANLGRHLWSMLQCNIDYVRSAGVFEKLLTAISPVVVVSIGIVALDGAMVKVAGLFFTQRLRVICFRIYYTTVPEKLV